MPENVFKSFNMDQYQSLNNEEEFHTSEQKELAWRGDIGQGYSKKLADNFLKNRYLISIKPIRLTLQKLLSVNSFKSTIKRLKNEGFLDWQILLILSYITVNYKNAIER